VSAGIFVVHTTQQAEEAGALVDLLETALALPDGSIACSHLPGYAWANGHGATSAEWEAMLGRVGAAIAIADHAALSSPQWMFDLAAAFGRGLWTVVLLDDAELAAQLPTQLTGATLALRNDESSVRSVVEDIAFELGLSPRMGKEAREAIETLSSIPPAQPAEARKDRGSSGRAAVPPKTLEEVNAKLAQARERAARPSAAEALAATADELDSMLSEAPGGDEPLREEPVYAEPMDDEPMLERDTPAEPTAPAYAASGEYEALETVPPPAYGSMSEPPFEALEELDDSEIEAIEEPDGLVYSHRTQPATCGMAFDAGRAMGECSFHRASGGDFARELSGAFGPFINAIGGDWSSLSRLTDVELWLGATDNLLDLLPATSRHLNDWYELGYQLSTLLSIAEGGALDDPEQHQAYYELWAQSLEQMQRSASVLGLPSNTLEQSRTRLQNLIGPEPARDYRNISGVLNTLRELAQTADGGNGSARAVAR
jgi:hypothetical protein